MKSADRSIPAAARWLGWATVAVLLIAVAGIGLISAGGFDPEPQGQLSFRRELKPVIVDAGVELLLWQREIPSEGHASLRLLAAFADGEADVGYGMAIGEQAHYLVAAVSPLGYLTVVEQYADGETEAATGLSAVEQHIIPWQDWPHVGLGTESNEIWIDVIGEIVRSIRVNRELLWQGDVPVSGRRVGLWLKSFGSEAEIDFQQLELFARS